MSYNTSEIPILGTDEEQTLFTEVHSHYTLARQYLDEKIPDLDKKDELFRSHIRKEKWPYRSQVFDPRTFTFITEKTARILANKPKGRLIPREGGDVVGAKINNELLSFQWDDNERVNNQSMISKWALMDQNARKYGAAFAVVPWHWERQMTKSKDGKEEKKWKVVFDGPDMRTLNNRDALPNPSYSVIKNWFQERSYQTLDELEQINETSRGKPSYKNLHLLRDSLKIESLNNGSGGNKRANNYTSKNLSLKGLTDFLGMDVVYKTIEIVTEYREDKWITIAPKYGVVIRDIPNPYEHGQIPVILLKYYIVDDDIYGLSEIEPVESLQKATNALICQYLDAANMSLYAPLKINQAAGSVQLHTLEFGPAAKWLMNNPQTDVVAHDQSITGVSEFSSTYRFMVGAMQEALGETSAAISNLTPGSDEKTATEVQDLATTRQARDNFNRIFLGEALKKQMQFWFAMNQQMLFNAGEKQKILRINNKEAIKYFQKVGMDSYGLAEDTIDSLAETDLDGVNLDINELQTPVYPVETDEGVKSKFEVNETGEMGTLIVEQSDILGNYDYIPDVGSMSITSDVEATKAKLQALNLITGNQVVMGLLQQEGVQLKARDFVVDLLEDMGFKNADQYFEAVPQNIPGIPGENVYAQQAGGGVATQGQVGAQPATVGRVQGGGQAVSRG